VQGSVALAGLLVEAARVLDDEVHHVQRVAGLVRDGVVQTSFSKFLKNKKPNFIYVNGFCSKCENIEKSINFIFETTLRSVHTRWLHWIKILYISRKLLSVGSFKFVQVLSMLKVTIVLQL
jgi:hypothetical protein